MSNTTKNSDLEQQVKKLCDQVDQLKNSSSQTLDEIAVLKNNYSQLVNDVSARFKVVHEKLFR